MSPRWSGDAAALAADVRRSVRGEDFNLDELLPEKGFHLARALTGTEGTCVTILEATVRLLSRLGLEAEILDPGCCGMAGAFGFEKEHYAVSVARGERVLLPAVRAAAPDTLVIADGFSCREQIVQTTGRRALHLAEVARLAMGWGGR